MKTTIEIKRADDNIGEAYTLLINGQFKDWARLPKKEAYSKFFKMIMNDYLKTSSEKYNEARANQQAIMEQGFYN
jgi:hypothetical protein